MKKRKTGNPKRRLIEATTGTSESQALAALADQVTYDGNPAHKRNPGDFGLTPPSAPRPNKTLCDGAMIFQRAVAQNLLREGMRRGLVSVQKVPQGWPKNVWAVAPNGIPLEGMLTNPETGSYHGYPLVSHDPLIKEILRRWTAV